MRVQEGRQLIDDDSVIRLSYTGRETTRLYQLLSRWIARNQSTVFELHYGGWILVVRAVGRRQRVRDQAPVDRVGKRIGAENPAAIAERAAVTDLEPIMIDLSLAQPTLVGINAPKVAVSLHLRQFEVLALGERGRIPRQETADHQPGGDTGLARPPEDERLFS